MEAATVGRTALFGGSGRGGGDVSDSVARIARDGDLDAAATFARQQPESAHLLGDAFANHNLGLLHALQQRVPAAFAAPGNPNSIAAANQPPAAYAGQVDLSDYDIQSIRDHEATAQEMLRATVPTDGAGNPLGHSGVTIGYGFDVGQRSHAEIQGHVENGTITQEFADRIRPYAGRTGSTAQKKLAKNPLEFTEADREPLERLSDTVYATTIEEIDQQYRRDSEAATGQERRLSDLPRSVRTAIADVGIQYGPGLPSATPNFWDQITNGRWSEAADNLHDFRDEYTTRRRDNEALFREAISNGLEDWRD